MKNYLFVTLIALVLYPFAGCSQPDRDIAKLKEELKQEILAELRPQSQTPAQIAAQENREQMREEMKAEIEREVSARIQDEVQRQVHTIANNLPESGDQSVQWRPGPAGGAEGRILRNGQGLADCKIKLIRLVRPQGMIEMFNTIKEGAEFSAVTDEQGKYVIDKLPAGAYKLKWQLPNDTGWIRRLRDKPDAFIEEGQVTVLDSVETNRRLAGRDN